MINEIMILLLVAFSFGEDPAKGKIQYTDEEITMPFVFQKTEEHYSMIPPELDLVLSSSINQDTIYVSFTSNQPLYAGWTDTTFCSTYPNWDYWWLNTRLGIDDLDTVYVLVSLFNYSNSNYNFHRDVLDYTGNVIYQDAEWNGYQMQPIVKDGFGNNHYIGHTLMGWNDNMDAGAVDALNFIYSSKANSPGNIFFTKLDSMGNFIYNQTPVATGDTAQSWAGDSHLDIDSQGNIYIAWSRDMHEIVYSKSSDGGATWSLPITIASDFANQVNKPEILVSPDDHIHFIWQHWTGAHNCLIYKKLYPGEACCVDTTNLTPGFFPEVWSPDFVMDADTNIHIVWSPSHQGSNSLYYTLINGKLDKGGLPATDNEITLVQEYQFYTNTHQKRYPKVVADSLCCPHVIFDQGQYGTGNTKTVYYLKETLSAQGCAVFPDSSVYNLVIDTVGGYTSSFPTSGQGTYVVKVWAWNASGEVGWDTASINITGIIEEQSANIKQNTPILSVNPNPFKQMTNIKFQMQDVRNKKQDISLKIYDVAGRIIRSFDLASGILPLASVVSWNGTDNSGNRVPPGVYFCRLRVDDKALTTKVIKLTE